MHHKPTSHKGRCGYNSNNCCNCKYGINKTSLFPVITMDGNSWTSESIQAIWRAVGCHANIPLAHGVAPPCGRDVNQGQKPVERPNDLAVKRFMGEIPETHLKNKLVGKN